MIGQLAAKIDRATRARAKTGDLIDEIRSLILRHQDEIAEIEARPVLLEVAQSRIADAINNAADDFLADLSLFHLAGPNADTGSVLRLDDRHDAYRDPTGDGPAMVFAKSGNMGRLAFAFSAPQVIEGLQARLASIYEERSLEGISDDDRGAEIERLRAEIQAAERLEERTIRKLEASGDAPLRRPDADPFVLLASDGAL